MQIAILGATGRMGKELLKAVHGEAEATLCAALVRKGNPLEGTDIGPALGIPAQSVIFTSDRENVFSKAEAVIDFTTPESSMETAAACAQHKLVHIVGTTGFTEEQEKQLKAYAGSTAIIHSHNFSVGVNLILYWVEQAAKALSADKFDIEVLEMHHRHKVDAPSGTAISLGHAAAKGRGIPLETVARYERQGRTGVRTPGEIGFATLRGGEVIGDHTVLFAGESERIEFTHKAQDRSIFAKGAVQAALWGKGKAPGLYTMRDVLGL